MHTYLRVPPDIDVVIFSGDCSNPKNPAMNAVEVLDFIEWFSNLPIKHKIFIPGNHDTSIERGFVNPESFTLRGIMYLVNCYIVIDGIKIWGSPVTPTFGHGWAWNEDRDKIADVWNCIEKDVDIIVTHGPPRGILDIAYSRTHSGLENAGCIELFNKIIEIKPKLSLFGHIHDTNTILNSGVLNLEGIPTTFSNGACAIDGNFFNPLRFHQGNILTI